MSAPHKSSSVRTISRHDLLTWEQVEEFGGWIDHQLAELERHFADYMTPLSLGKHRGARDASASRRSDDESTDEGL